MLLLPANCISGNWEWDAKKLKMHKMNIPDKKVLFNVLLVLQLVTFLFLPFLQLKIPSIRTKLFFALLFRTQLVGKTRKNLKLSQFIIQT